RIKNIVRALREAIDANDLQKAEECFKIANKDLHKFVSKGILNKNTAARKVLRLNAALKKARAA
ncbi:MAG: 30S ribosomal protein S20, partial [Helicobacter sp.]|nr:30S ribosomal protein S20 [Helicobacter sp.]